MFDDVYDDPGHDLFMLRMLINNFSGLELSEPEVDELHDLKNDLECMLAEHKRRQEMRRQPKFTVIYGAPH